MNLKGQLHIHTIFSDGRLTPQEASDTYEDLGFDFIVITDHDHLLRPGYREAIEGVRSNMLVFLGIELTLHTRWGYVHVNETIPGMYRGCDKGASAGCRRGVPSGFLYASV